MEQYLEQESLISILQSENAKLKQELEDLRTKLAAYTNPKRVKDYQERNKDIISQKKKEYYQKKKDSG